MSLATSRCIRGLDAVHARDNPASSTEPNEFFNGFEPDGNARRRLNHYYAHKTHHDHQTMLLMLILFN